MFFPSLSYFFGPSQVIPRRALYSCKHSLVCLTEDGLFAAERCRSSAFNVAAENIINTGPYYIPPNDHIGQRDTSHIHVNLRVQPHGRVHRPKAKKKKKKSIAKTTQTNKHLTQQSETQSRRNESHRACLTEPVPLLLVKSSLARRLTGLYLLLFHRGHLFHCLH